MIQYATQTKGLEKPITRAPRRDPPDAQIQAHMAGNNRLSSNSVRPSANTKRPLSFLSARYPPAVTNGLRRSDSNGTGTGPRICIRLSHHSTGTTQTET